MEVSSKFKIEFLVQKGMREALSLAEEAAAHQEVPVGAVVIDRLTGDFLGKGRNFKEALDDPTAHAEILALREACQRRKNWRLTGCLLVTTLEPCMMCLGALQQARFDGVYYGASDPKGGALSLGYLIHQDQRTNHRFPVEYLETQEARELLKIFFAERRKRCEKRRLC